MSHVALTADPAFALVPDSSHGDGTYYYAIALDPFARGQPHTLIDQAAYRYGHPGYGWLAGILSLGNAAALPRTLFALDLLGLFAAAVTISVVASRWGWSPWTGLLVAVSPGLISCVTQDLAEPLALAFAALGVLMWLRGRLLPAAVLFSVACLFKEEFALVPLGFAFWYAIEWRRGRPPDRLLARTAALAAGPLALIAWYAYLRADFGTWPSSAGGPIGPPFVGWIDTFHIAGRFIGYNFGAMQIGTFMVPVLAIVAVALAFGAARALTLRSPLDAIYVLFAVLALFLNWAALLYPKDMARDLLVPLLLLPAVIVSRVPSLTRVHTRASERSGVSM